MKLHLDNGGIAEITLAARELLEPASICKHNDLRYRCTIKTGSGNVGIIARGNTPNQVAENLVKQVQDIIVDKAQ